MTTVGLLYPGHAAEDDFPRIEVMLDSDIRVPLFHTDIDEDARRVENLREAGAPDRLSAGVEELRMAGAESLVWACSGGSFAYGWDGAHEQAAALARAAGLPASSSSVAFVEAVRELGASASRSPPPTPRTSPRSSPASWSPEASRSPPPGAAASSGRPTPPPRTWSS